MTDQNNNPVTTIKSLNGFFTRIKEASEPFQLFKQFKLVPPSWTEITRTDTRNVKVAFFVRHGEGLHNEAIKLYCSERWYKELVTSDVYRDADLTPFGIQDAKNKGPPSIKAEMERGMPPIERVIVSPISRAIQTAQNFFTKDQVPDKPFICMEGRREHLGVDTCNNRCSLSELTVKFPDVDFSARTMCCGLLTTVSLNEEIQARAKEFLSELFRMIPERYVAVVSHFGFIEVVCIGGKLIVRCVFQEHITFWWVIPATMTKIHIVSALNS